MTLLDAKLSIRIYIYKPSSIFSSLGQDS